MFRRTLVALLLPLALLLPACGESEAPIPAGSGPELVDGKADGTAAARYTDVESYTLDHGGYDEWYAMVQGLKGDFDNICGDTFCEGDYAPWTIKLSCSVALADGKLKHCTWLFAAANSAVNPRTGTISHEKKFYTCKLPWSGLTPTELSTLLAPGTGFSDRALDRALPAGKSTYEALGDCDLGS